MAIPTPVPGSPAVGPEILTDLWNQAVTNALPNLLEDMGSIQAGYPERVPATKADLAATEQRLTTLIQNLSAQLTETEKELMDPLQVLQQQVTQNTNLEQSAITLIQGLAAQIAANANNPAALTALSTQLQTSATALSAAIVANTPAANPPAPAPASTKKP